VPEKLTETALAMLTFGCEAYGIVAPGAGDDIDEWAKASAKDEIMLHDFGAAVAAAQRFDANAMNGSLHSIATYFEQRDRPIVRRLKDLQGD
jgi:hypothetical protein